VVVERQELRRPMSEFWLDDGPRPLFIFVSEKLMGPVFTVLDIAECSWEIFTSRAEGLRRESREGGAKGFKGLSTRPSLKSAPTKGSRRDEDSGEKVVE